MDSTCEESYLKAGFYYNLKFVTALLFLIFMVVFAVLHVLADFAIFALIFLCTLFYLDLQEFIEVKVPLYGWKCSKSDYKIPQPS